MAAVRYPWMFRTAAVVFVLLGLGWLWTFGFTMPHDSPVSRPWGLAAGFLAVVIGVFQFRLARLAIGISALAATVVALSAAAFIATARGPVIPFLVGITAVCGLYAALAGRVLLERPR